MNVTTAYVHNKSAFRQPGQLQKIDYIHSDGQMSQRDVVNLSFTNIPMQNNEVLEYLKFASGVSGYERDIDSFSYIDEIKSLGIHKDKKDNLRVLESRFSDSEASVLDALDIGWNSEY